MLRSPGRPGDQSGRRWRKRFCRFFLTDFVLFITKSLMEDPKHPQDHREESRLFAEGMRYVGVASQFVVTLLLLGYIGYRVDESKSSSPWGVLVGFLVGMMLGTWLLLRQLSRMERKNKP